MGYQHYCTQCIFSYVVPWRAFAIDRKLTQRDDMGYLDIALVCSFFMNISRQTRILIALVLVALASYIAGVPITFPTSAQNDTYSHDGTYRVVRVIDGDTIVVDQNGTDLSVRLIGIDTPEVNSPVTKAECFGSEASRASKQLFEGKMVYLETDPTQATFDAYDRLLAYAFLPATSTDRTTSANEYLIREGFAREYTYRAAYRYQTQFTQAEREARREQKGLWSLQNCPRS
jgi:micrococcal nuclease